MHSSTARLILVRHGESTANLANRMQGRSDAGLTPRGQQQVIAIAQRLKQEAKPINAIYTSTLKRALLTAEVIGKGLRVPIYPREDLQEVDMGDLEGLPASEMLARAPSELDERYPGGESLQEFCNRVMGAIEAIVSSLHQGGTAVIVSHGGVISTALSYCKHEHGRRWREYIPANCAISIVEFGSSPSVISFNDRSHL